VIDPARNASGPVVWAAIIAVTLLLLLMFQQMLWLVVPALLALVLYYALFPAVHALAYRGVSRDRAASLVMAGFGLAAALIGVFLLPPVLDYGLDWQAAADRYLQGGLNLIDSTLRVLESRFVALAEANLADAVGERLSASGQLVDRLEPWVIGIVTWTPSLLLAPFLTYFFLRDGRRFQHFLARAVPNAFFERSLALLHEVDRTARAYFEGLLKLTVLDTATLAAGLWLMDFPGALALGFVCALLAWIPYVGSVVGGLLVVLVAATDFPQSPAMAYSAAGLFIFVRLLDDFVYMPLTVGRDLHMHPLVTVVMIFAGGAVAGIAGLMLVLPLLGVVRVIGETVGVVVTDVRLRVRHQHAMALRRRHAAAELGG
jgi:predicted PurR-regulated permease PerM